jgi:hypothetical protein
MGEERVTRDDIRKLIGGYATGSLSETEKRALFEAALDDQELFDELAREQSLKEMLDQPGAKQRLIASLADRPPGDEAWWRRPWAWTAAAAIVALAVGVTSWTLLRTPKPMQVAVVQVPLAPVNEAPAVDATEPRTETRAAPSKPLPVRRAKAQPVDADRKDQPEPEAKKDAPAPAPSPASAPPPPPQQQQPQQQQQQQPQQKQEQESSSQVQVQAQAGFRDSSTVTGGGGARAGRVVPLPGGPAFAPLLAKANLFGFDYGFEPGFLTIKTSAAGTLTVSAATCFTCDGFAGLSRARVEKDSTTRIPVASQYVVLAITFSAQSEADKSSDTQAPTVARTSTARTGMVADPNPSQNSKIALRLELR